MKLRVSTAKEALQAFPESTFISKSGVYDVTIKFASLAVTASGAESVNFNVDFNGNDQTLYGPYITSKDGNVIEVGARLINNLAVIAGMQEGETYDLASETHAVGKDKKPQEFEVITNFSDLPVKVQLQESYGINPNTNQIRKSLVIKNFFNAEGATAAELISSKDIGKQLAIVQEKYANNVTYEDGLTAEDVEKWKASQASGAKAAPKPTPKAATAKPSTSLFK